MKLLLKIIYGILYDLFLPILVHPPGKQTKSGYYTYHRINLINFLKEQSKEIHGKVLDVGAGTWIYPREILSSRCKYISTDCFMHPNVDVICDIHMIGNCFIHKSFDFILCFDVLEHVAQPWLAIEQMKHLLKDEGTLILTTPFHYALHANEAVKDYWRISEDGLKFLLQNYAEFSYVDTRSIGHPRYPYSIMAIARK